MMKVGAGTLAQKSRERCNLLPLRRCRRAARFLRKCLRGAAVVPLVRLRLAIPVRRLARGVAVAHLPAPATVLCGGRFSAQVTRLHEC
jgi:hypothetical protein